MSLWLCARFPDMPLEALVTSANHAQEQAVVVIERQRVISVNDEASVYGVQIGQSTTTAQALLGETPKILLERDRQREQETLQQLQVWAYSITPTLECWLSDSLQLEIGSCLTLHGGDLHVLLRKVAQALQQRGFQALFGVAENRLAAWLLSHRNDAVATDTAQPLNERLGDLSIDLLVRADSGANAAVDGLRKAGLTTLRDIFTLSSASLGRRCGKHFADRVTGLTSTSDRVSVDFSPPPRFYDALWFGFDVRNSAELAPALAQLLQNFCRFLLHCQLDSSEIEWQLLRPRESPFCFTVRSTEAHQQQRVWYELSVLQLDTLTIPEDVEGVAIEVNELRPINSQINDLFESSSAREPLGSLLDRLRTRLGLNAVAHFILRDSHLPEHCQQLSHNHTDDSGNIKCLAQRPFWLMAEPQPIRLEGETLHWNGALKILYGPERIEDNWWQQPTSRDYYIASAASGESLWVFNDRRSGRWYVHGIMP